MGTFRRRVSRQVPHPRRRLRHLLVRGGSRQLASDGDYRRGRRLDPSTDLSSEWLARSSDGSQHASGRGELLAIQRIAWKRRSGRTRDRAQVDRSCSVIRHRPRFIPPPCEPCGFASGLTARAGGVVGGVPAGLRPEPRGKGFTGVGPSAGRSLPRPRLFIHAIKPIGNSFNRQRTPIDHRLPCRP